MMIGYIYIIRSKQTNKVYVGSTVQSLNERFSNHKSKQNCSSVEILKYPDATIELLECYECENLQQLRKREGEYIRKYNCVNKEIAGRTRQEWREDNKEKDKQYYENNKEKINQKFTCPCGGRYTHIHKAIHFKTKKHLEFLTKQN